MWAIVETGGKQFQVKKGDILEVEKLDGEIGKTVDLTSVLCISKDEDGLDLSVGTPYVKNAKITAKIVETAKSKKVTILKYKAKKRYKVKRGHRQQFSKIEIVDIKD